MSWIPGLIIVMFAAWLIAEIVNKTGGKTSL